MKTLSKPAVFLTFVFEYAIMNLKYHDIFLPKGGIFIMKKHHLILTTVTALFLLTGCQTSSSGQTNPNAVEISYPLTIHAGYSTTEDDPRGLALKIFQDTVQQKTNGDIIIELHPAGELGSDAELIEKMTKGEVDMTVSSAGNYAVYAPRIGVSALPFLFENFESAWAFVDSDDMQEINKDLESYNMHVLSYFDNGFRCVTTSEAVGAVNSVEDMNGLNIRTPENQIVMETMKALSANPQSFPFAELKQALADGQFDAQENPIPIIYNNQLYEVQKYLSVTNHSYDAMPLTIRQDIWDGLTPEYQDILSIAAEVAGKQNRVLIKNQTTDMVKRLEAEGMEIVYPDLKPFQEATSGVKNIIYGQDLPDVLK
ncbi:MAG: TRAP transporter substrate-binding protein [Ruminococcus sp.]|nr:TRAP transporter substrate-binding protein [Ruminococcus sp.]